MKMPYRLLLPIFLGLVTSVNVFSYGSSKDQPSANMAMSHLEHVYKSWATTPDKKGFITVALEEASIARIHTDLALNSNDSLDSIKLHSQHITHALGGKGKGPGLGYGVSAAAKGVSKHVMLAAQSPGSSDAIQTHALHVSTSAKNVTTWSKSALKLTKKIEKTDDLQEARAYLNEVDGLIKAIVNGTDENNDGAVSWEKGEGGLEQAVIHINIIKAAEGIY
jgi:hypothetical protein